MTKDMMALRGLLEKSGDTDLPRKMIGFAAEWLMAFLVRLARAWSDVIKATVKRGNPASRRGGG